MKKEIKQKPVGFRIKEVASFECMIWQNAVNICTSLAQAGRYVKIRTVSGKYIIEIYEMVF